MGVDWNHYGGGTICADCPYKVGTVILLINKEILKAGQQDSRCVRKIILAHHHKDPKIPLESP
jgi:hypothetical protein